MRFSKKEAVVSTAIAVAAVAMFSGMYLVDNPPLGLEQAKAAQSRAASLPTPNDVSAANTVTLESRQLQAIKVEPLGEHLFAREREAVGRIDLEEDLPVVQAESALVGAAATFEATSKALARAKALNAAHGGVSQKELEQAVSEQQTAESALKAARHACGVLGKTEAEIDQMIASGKCDPVPISAGEKWGLANVAESDSPLLCVGQSVKVTVKAYPDRRFAGKIFRIYSAVDLETHRTKIRCKIADPNHELRPGMLADFIIGIQEPAASTAIPADGVVREGDGTMTVWVTTDRRAFTTRTVKVGLRKDGWCQILEGLERGELVVTEGGVFLSNMLNAPPAD